MSSNLGDFVSIDLDTLGVGGGNVGHSGNEALGRDAEDGFGEAGDVVAKEASSEVVEEHQSEFVQKKAGVVSMQGGSASKVDHPQSREPLCMIHDHNNF